MKRTIMLFFILIASCSNPEKDSIDYKNLILTEDLASKLISLSINCVDKKYPYKIGYRFIDENWIKPHYEVTPSFYGCWDWHSAVHGHWAMVKVLK